LYDEIHELISGATSNGCCSAPSPVFTLKTQDYVKNFDEFLSDPLPAVKLVDILKKMEELDSRECRLPWNSDTCAILQNLFLGAQSPYLTDGRWPGSALFCRPFSEKSGCRNSLPPS
jgi:hypothetical protein